MGVFEDMARWRRRRVRSNRRDKLLDHCDTYEKHPQIILLKHYESEPPIWLES